MYWPVFAFFIAGGVMTGWSVFKADRHGIPTSCLEHVPRCFRQRAERKTFIDRWKWTTWTKSPWNNLLPPLGLAVALGLGVQVEGGSAFTQFFVAVAYDLPMFGAVGITYMGLKWWLTKRWYPNHEHVESSGS